MDTKKFADCMKRHMEEKNITTESLSEMTGISVSRLKEYESGNFKAKGFEITEIGNALGVPPLILMHGGGVVHASSLDENGHKICKWDEY